MTNGERLLELLGGPAGPYVGGIVAQWVERRRRDSLQVPRELVEVVLLLRPQAPPVALRCVPVALSEDRCMPMKDAAAALGVTRQAVQKMVDRGALRGVQPGGPRTAWLVSEADVAELRTMREAS